MRNSAGEIWSQWTLIKISLRQNTIQSVPKSEATSWEAGLSHRVAIVHFLRRNWKLGITMFDFNREIWNQTVLLDFNGEIWNQKILIMFFLMENRTQRAPGKAASWEAARA